MERSADEIRSLLGRLSVKEVATGERYYCGVCRREWFYADGPSWWRCPTEKCADWMREAGPGADSAIRGLMGSRPATPIGTAAPRDVGGRPRGPKVALREIHDAYREFVRDRGHPPTHRDLADILEVSVSTIRNYYCREYLPPKD